MREIVPAEGVTIGAARKWLFDTRAECLKCTKAELAKIGPIHGRFAFRPSRAHRLSGASTRAPC
jgi:hypothetical protein